MRQLRSDGFSEELTRLVPEVSVSAGCFNHWLMQPGTLSSKERSKYFQQERSEATSLCVQELLKQEGLPRTILGWQDNGSRKWPTGYVGSVSHKGTKVAAVLAASNQLRSVGIDIELRSGSSELSGIPGLSVADGTTISQQVDSEVIVFSVKEAIFKAANLVARRQLDFDEVTLSWKDAHQNRFFGIGRYDGLTLDVRCSLSIPKWIVSAALMLNEREGRHSE